MSEEHETFPNAVEATLLIVVLFALQIAVASVLLSFDRFANVDPLDLSGLITVAGNGILFSLLLSYKKLSYRDLFHPARHSVASTLGLLAIPIVLLVPGLVIAAGTLKPSWGMSLSRNVRTKLSRQVLLLVSLGARKLRGNPPRNQRRGTAPGSSRGSSLARKGLSSR